MRTGKEVDVKVMRGRKEEYIVVPYFLSSISFYNVIITLILTVTYVLLEVYN